MGRIRTIKPEFHSHEELSALPAETHLLAAALTNYADDYGYFNANPLLVKAGTNPLRSDKTKIEDQLKQLESVGYIAIRRKSLKALGRIVNFESHQRVSHPSPSKLKDKFEELPKDSGEVPEDIRPEQGTGNREQGIEREQGKALVERVFAFYCEKVSKDPKRYTLTAERQAKALSRIAERLKANNGDMAKVKEELKLAIENLAASDYHRENGYLDWTDQIFRSAEEFEKRLNWTKPMGGKPNGTNRSVEYVSPARQREINSNAAIERVLAKRQAARELDAAGQGLLPESGTGGGDGRGLLEGVGGDCDQVQDGAI